MHPHKLYDGLHLGERKNGSKTMCSIYHFVPFKHVLLRLRSEFMGELLGVLKHSLFIYDVEGEESRDNRHGRPSAEQLASDDDERAEPIL